MPERLIAALLFAAGIALFLRGVRDRRALRREWLRRKPAVSAETFAANLANTLPDITNG